MPYDEYQAAIAIAGLQSENRELRKQLESALKRLDQLSQENRQLKERLAELERKAAIPLYGDLHRFIPALAARSPSR